MNDTENDVTQETIPAEDPAGQPARRLVRYPDRGPGAGVAEGLGSYFGLDPVIFRIAFVLLAFAGGSGILAYLVAWAVMPEAEEGATPATGPRPDNEQLMTWAGIALIVIAAAMLFSGPFDLFRPGVLWALALIGGGVLLFQADRNRQQPVPASQEAFAQDPTPAAGPATGAPAPAAPPGPPPPPPPPPSPVGRLTVGVALVASGCAALLDYAGAIDMGAVEYVALLLAVVGGGLVVSTWWGRARGLIAAGIVLVVLLAGHFAVGQAVHLGGGVGEREWAPASAAEVDDSYELFAGEAVLDLSDVELSGETSVRAGVTFGSLTVVVPRDVTVHARAQVTGGEVDLLGARASGLGVERGVSDTGPPGAPELRLDLRSAFGEIIVRRAR